MAEGTQLPPQLLKYWLHGEGAAKIQWGHDGDYNRCIVNVQEAVAKHGTPLGDRTVHGLCATLHKLATGGSPGHAPGEGAGKH